MYDDAFCYGSSYIFSVTSDFDKKFMLIRNKINKGSTMWCYLQSMFVVSTVLFIISQWTTARTFFVIYFLIIEYGYINIL